MNELKIKQYDFDKFTNLKSFACIMLGSRNCGKTYLLNHIYEDINREFKLILLFSNTLSSGQYKFIKKYKSNQIIKKYDTWKPELINKLMNEKLKSKTLVIIDDLYSNKIIYDEALLKLITQGRHFNISTFLLSQSPTMMNKNLRLNATHLVLLNLKGNNRAHVIENFLMDLIDINDIKPYGYTKLKDFFEDLLKWTFTEKYRGLLIDYDNTDFNNMTDLIRTFKAP